MLRPLITIGCLTVAGAVSAEPVPLTNETIKETLAGSLLEMDTPLGTKIPIRFSTNGLVSGEAGILSGVLGAEKDRGRWWTKNDQLCVKWFRWFEAKPKCASLRQDGTRIYWHERSGETGTATLAERARPAAPTTVAKAAPEPKPQPPKAQPEPAPEQQQVAASEPAPETRPVIKQRTVTTKPLDDDAPQLMFAGMTGLQDVSMLRPQEASEPKIETKQIDEPRDTQQVAALTVTQPQTREPQPPQAPQRKVSVSGSAVTSAVEPHTQREIVDIDAMGTGGARGTGLREIRQVSFRVAGVRSDDMLNVRSGPSEFHQPVGRIPPAARGVKIVGNCRGEWCPIRRGQLEGWVNSYYLAEETTASRR